MFSRVLRRAATTAVAVGVLAGATPAAADELAAQWVGQSEFPTMESGDVVTSYFDAKNVGSATWEQGWVNLGTAAPRDRASVFYDPDHWLNPGRAVHLDQATVAPGQVGRFTFKMHAPKVSAPTRYQEGFEPVWDGRAWMGGTTLWPNVYLVYTVLPPEAPAVTITSVPATVVRGEPIAVVAEARDNHRVTEVRIQDVAGTPIAGTQSYRAELDSATLAPGPHVITVKATDPGGRAAEAAATIEVVAAPSSGGGTAGGRSEPAVFDARISSLFVWNGATTKFSSVRITDLPRTATAQLTCKGNGCRFARRAIRTRAGR